MSTRRTRWVVGCMTGTSIDGLDSALATIDGEGEKIEARFVGAVHGPLGALRDILTSLARGEPHPPIRYMLAARQLGQLHAEAVAELCVRHLPKSAALAMVVVHGQTICHAPPTANRAESPDQAEPGLSWQLFDPWPLVRRLGVPVLYDLRQADLIGGGQGAPITPMADWIMFRHPSRHRVIVNLGGICNHTDLPPGGGIEQVGGGDWGPCNLLIDGLVRRLFPSLDYDVDGRIAARGRPGDFIDGAMKSIDALRQQRDNFGGRHASLGRENIGDPLIDRIAAAADADGIAPEDLIASAVEWVAAMIHRQVSRIADAADIVLAGGGALNPYLVERIDAGRRSTDRLIRCDELGVPATGREAVAMAVLGAATQDGLPITLPQVTACLNPGKAGTWSLP